MTQDAIMGLLARGEGATVEFKRSLTKEIGRELCAFANAGGGIVLVGVSDAGQIVGVTDASPRQGQVSSYPRC